MNILMYHSISTGRAPLCLTPECFREQLRVLAELGMRGVSLAEGVKGGPHNQVVLTFDDGYRDLLQVVAPELAIRGWTATVFLAPQCTERGWCDADSPAPLLNWAAAAELVRAGWEIGSHSLTHRDLTRLSESEVVTELRDSRSRLEDRLQTAVTSFAAPFGRATRRVRAIAAQHYRRAVSTRLAVATSADDPYDLPRLEMWYFQDPARWRAHLDGGGRFYLSWRRGWRWLGQLWRGECPWRNWG